MAEIVKNVDDTTKVFIAIMVLGLSGLLFLIVFGNLSGNLGFADITNETVNESGYGINSTTYTLTPVSSSRFVSASVTVVHNATDGTIVNSGNYTVDATAGTIVGSAGRSFNWSANLTYTTTLDSQAEDNTNSVINNLTSGVSTFFTFSNVWFTLLAIVLLIIIVMSVIAVVQSKQGSFSS